MAGERKCSQWEICPLGLPSPLFAPQGSSSHSGWGIRRGGETVSVLKTVDEPFWAELYLGWGAQWECIYVSAHVSTCLDTERHV